MKKSFSLILSLILVICMMASLSVSAFAAEETEQVSFDGVKDMVFVYGDNELSIAQELGLSALNKYTLKTIWNHFTTVAERDELPYTTETQDTNFVVTIGEDTFVSAFMVKNTSGYTGSVKVQVLAASTEEEISNVTIYLWEGDVTAEEIDLASAEATLEVELDEQDAALVKLNRASFPFFNSLKGFTFAASFTMADGTEVISNGEYLIHYGFLATDSQGNSTKDNDSGDKDDEDDKDPTEPNPPEEPEDEIIPWKNLHNFVHHPAGNDTSVKINVAGVSVEIGDRGWAVTQEDDADHISFKTRGESYTIVPSAPEAPAEETPAE